MIYLYLASRDKRDVVVVTVFQGKSTVLKVGDLQSLGLPHPWLSALENATQPYRRCYDLWMESAEDVVALRETLKRRGFTRLPVFPGPLLWLSTVPSGLERAGMHRGGQVAPALDPLILRKLQLANHPSRAPSA